MQRRLLEFRHLGAFAIPDRGEGFAINRLQWLSAIAFSEAWTCSIGRISRTRRSISPSSSISEGADTCTRPGRLGVGQQPAMVGIDMGQCVGQRHRPLRRFSAMVSNRVLRARRRVGVDGLAVGDDEALRRQRFKTDVIDAAGDGPLHLGVEQFAPKAVNRWSEARSSTPAAVQKGGDRRQLVFDAIVVHQLQAGGRLEAVERATVDLAAHDQEIELRSASRRMAIPGLSSGRNRP